MSDSATVCMILDTIVMDPSTQNPVMILRGKQDPQIYLPIFIGQLEAASIAGVMAGMTPPRPMTHDLLLSAMDALEAAVTRVTITSLHQDTYFASLSLLSSTGETQTVDARPSDCIALAVRAGIDIHVSEEVLAIAGGYSTMDVELAPPISAPNAPAARLEDLDHELFGKYKM